MKKVTKNSLSLDELIALSRRVEPDNWNKHFHEEIARGGGRSGDILMRRTESYIGTLPGLITVRLVCDLHPMPYTYLAENRPSYSISVMSGDNMELGSKSLKLESPIKLLYQEIKSLYESRKETSREKALRKAREILG